MTETKKAPVALFVYNRPIHTKKAIDALRRNAEALNTDLYIFSDAPKHQEAFESVNQVRQVIKFISGFRTVTITEQKENLGLANSIISGVTNIVNKHGRVIVMEDDLLTSPYFLTYLNEALDKYEHDTRVISIHGYSYPTKVDLPETFFLRGADCWGWATWQRGWNDFEADGQKLLDLLRAQKLTKSFDFNGQIPFTKMLEDQIAGKNNSWAIRWNASAFIKNKLTLHPGKSLVENIGFDNSGTHRGTDNRFKVNLYQSRIIIRDIDVEPNEKAYKLISDFFRQSKPSIFRRLTKILNRFTNQTDDKNTSL